MADLKIAGRLQPRHSARCAVFDPTPSACDCDAKSVPLVRLDDAQKAIEAARAAVPAQAGAAELDVKAIHKAVLGLRKCQHRAI